MSDSPALQVVGAAVRLGGVAVVDGVSLQVEPGGWLGIVGPNGAGKSTLLRAVAALAPLTAGEIHVDGRNLRTFSHAERARAIGLVAQEPVVPAGMTVRDYVLLGRNPHIPWFAVESVHDVRVVEDTIEALELSGFAGRVVQTLSGGERQRAVIARALAQGAPLLLLDEPTTALDIGHVQEALDLVDRMRLERGLTIVSAMHDLTVASQYADRLVMLDKGRLVAEGTPTDVLTAERLAEHYGVRARILHDPEAGVLVLPRRARRNSPN